MIRCVMPWAFRVLRTDPRTAAIAFRSGRFRLILFLFLAFLGCGDLSWSQPLPTAATATTSVGVAGRLVSEAAGEPSMWTYDPGGISSRPSGADDAARVHARGRPGLQVGSSSSADGVATEEAGGSLRGEFSISDWSGYPAGVPRPSGPFRLLEGQEYADARASANAANRALRRGLPDSVKPYLDVHEIQPVKFGGDATDVANKILLDVDSHAAVSAWWRRIQSNAGG
jgi:hypothetical protein